MPLKYGFVLVYLGWGITSFSLFSGVLLNSYRLDFEFDLINLTILLSGMSALLACFGSLSDKRLLFVWSGRASSVFIVLNLVLSKHLTEASYDSTYYIMFFLCIAVLLVLMTTVNTNNIYNVSKDFGDTMLDDYVILNDETHTDEPEKSSLWTISRILGIFSLIITCCLFIIVFSNIRFYNWYLLTASVSLFISTLTLIFLPRIGSYVFSSIVVCAALALMGALIMTLKDFSRGVSIDFYLIVLIVGICMLLIGIAVMLLSKESKEEWKNDYWKNLIKASKKPE